MQAALGGAPFDLRLAVLEAVAAEDVAGALVGVHELLTQGHDVRRVADDLLRTLRDAFLAANADGPGPLRRSAPRKRRSSPRSRRRWATRCVVRGIEILGQAIVDIRQQAVADPRLVLEVAVVRVARREARTSVETLLDRVERLERQLAAGGAAPAGRAGGRTAHRRAPPAAARAAPEPASDAPATRTRAGARAPARAAKAGGARARTSADRRAAARSRPTSSSLAPSRSIPTT